jgi:hypothetical protein
VRSGFYRRRLAWIKSVALEAVPKEAGYIERLSASWDAALATLEDVPEPPYDEAKARALSRLARNARTCRPEDAIEWIDIYPSGVFSILGLTPPPA